MKNSIAFILTFFLSLKLYGQNKFDVFYLSVGSANYAPQELASKDTLFTDIPGARRSARYVHEYFRDHSNGQGELIQSEEFEPITREQVFSAVNRMIEKAKKSKAKKPLLVFYFVGHGVSEGIGWSQFLVPGDWKKKTYEFFGADGNPDLIGLEEEMIMVGSLTDILNDSKLPYLVLIDACYEGKEENFSVLENFMNSTATQNIRDIADILRFMNEYHSPNPVVFATPPGTKTATVEDPISPEGVYIGPLCRKLLQTKRVLNDTGELSLLDVVLLLRNKEFDEKTPFVVSNYQADEQGFYTLFKK